MLDEIKMDEIKMDKAYVGWTLDGWNQDGLFFYGWILDAWNHYGSNLWWNKLVTHELLINDMMMELLWNSMKFHECK